MMFSGVEKLTKTVWYPLYGLLPQSIECNLEIRCPMLFLERVRANRWATRAQAGALLAKLLQTLIYNLFCFFWQKRWVVSGLI